MTKLCVRVCLRTGNVESVGQWEWWSVYMITLVCYLCILTGILVLHPCACTCVFVCVAQRGGGVHGKHTDEFPACADQITLPTPFLSLRLSFSQSCLLPLLFCAGKQLCYSTEWCFWPAAATVFEFLITWEPCLVFSTFIRCIFMYVPQSDQQLLKYTPYSLYNLFPPLARKWTSILF